MDIDEQMRLAHFELDKPDFNWLERRVIDSLTSMSALDFGKVMLNAPAQTLPKKTTADWYRDIKDAMDKLGQVPIVSGRQPGKTLLGMDVASNGLDTMAYYMVPPIRSSNKPVKVVVDDIVIKHEDPDQFFWSSLQHAKRHKLQPLDKTPHQNQHKRKPQPNRGPVGPKDWSK